MNNFEVRIWQDCAYSRMCIVFSRITFDFGREYLNFYTNEIGTIKEGETIPDKFIMHIPFIIANEFLQKFAEALDSQGIKTDKDAKIQGTLEATRFHLSDLRQLLKLK